MKSYKTEITLHAPEKSESDSCRERIFNLIEELQKAKEVTNDKTQLQNTRDYQIHHIKYLANRLLWETNG